MTLATMSWLVASAAVSSMIRLLPGFLRRGILLLMGFRFAEDEVWLTVRMPGWIAKEKTKKLVRDLKAAGHDVRLTADGYVIRKERGAS